MHGLEQNAWQIHNSETVRVAFSIQHQWFGIIYNNRYFAKWRGQGLKTHKTRDTLVLSCLILSYLILSCLVLSCLVLPRLLLSCLVLSCLVVSCLVLSWKLMLHIRRQKQQRMKFKTCQIQREGERQRRRGKLRQAIDRARLMFFPLPRVGETRHDMTCHNKTWRDKAWQGKTMTWQDKGKPKKRQAIKRDFFSAPSWVNTKHDKARQVHLGFELGHEEKGCLINFYTLSPPSPSLPPHPPLPHFRIPNPFPHLPPKRGLCGGLSCPLNWQLHR